MIKNPGADIYLKKVFLEEGISYIRVTYLGPNLCILEDLVGGKVELFIKERRSWWEQWFTLIKPWEQTDIDREIMVWLNLIGVPCHAWDERLFTLLVETRGCFIKCDEETKLKLRMDEARINIKKWMEKVDDTIKIVIEGVAFIIRIYEFRPSFNVKSHSSWLRGESESKYYVHTDEDLAVPEGDDNGSKTEEEEEVDRSCDGTTREKLHETTKTVGDMLFSPSKEEGL